MIMGLLAAWRGSRWVFYAVTLLAGAVGYEGWKYHQREIGASKVVEKIEKKADGNAKAAGDVRTDVAAGAGRVRSKYVRPDQ